MKALLWWILRLVSGLCALFGTFLVIFNGAEAYFLLTGRVQPDFEQPPLSVVVPLLALGVVLLIGGLALYRFGKFKQS